MLGRIVESCCRDADTASVGYNPLNPDTDFDGLGDSCDDDPIQPYVPAAGEEPHGCTTQA